MNGQLASFPYHPFLQQALSEHRELERLVGEVRCRLAAPVDQASELDYKDALAQIAKLRERLESHFEQEEAGGCFDEAVSRLPRIAPQAASLQKQHGQFVRTVNEILRVEPDGQDWRNHWKRLQTEFERFAKKLEAHENAENEILGRAFNVEVG